MHPIAPFITEEIFSIIKEKYPSLKIKSNADPYTKDFIESISKKACIVSNYPKKLFEADQKAIDDFELVKDILHLIRNIRSEMNFPISDKTDVYVLLAKKALSIDLIKENEHIIKPLGKVDNFVFVSKESDLPLGSFAILKTVKFLIPLSEDLIQKENARLEKQKEKLEKDIESYKNRLMNETFLSKAPKNVVEDLKKAFEESNLKLKEIEKKIISYTKK